MPTLTYLGLAEKIIQEQKSPLSPSEIWKIAVSKAYDKELQSTGKTPEATLYSAIFSDARDNLATKFVKLGQRPARYYLKSLPPVPGPVGVEALVVPDDAQAALLKYSESDLHPFLAYFADRRLRALCKTIRHNTSSKKEFGEWVHPDIIGVYFASDDWRPEVMDLSAATGNASVILYSFELKKALSFSNLRESFFQAVSNSSWANEGYLAAADISTDEDFLSELRRLSSAFGIGIIALSVQDPDASEIISPAKTREVVDWDTLNKMTMNKDVIDLLKRIRNDLSTKEVIREKYDAVHPLPMLLELFKKQSSSSK